MPCRRRAHSTGRGGASPALAWIDDSDDSLHGPEGSGRAGGGRSTGPRGLALPVQGRGPVRRRPAPAGPGRTASGPHTSYCVTRSLHSPLAPPVRPHSTLHLPRRNCYPEPHRLPSRAAGFRPIPGLAGRHALHSPRSSRATPARRLSLATLYTRHASSAAITRHALHTPRQSGGNHASRSSHATPVRRQSHATLFTRHACSAAITGTRHALRTPRQFGGSLPQLLASISPLLAPGSRAAPRALAQRPSGTPPVTRPGRGHPSHTGPSRSSRCVLLVRSL
jgi:hypothetical protein